MRPNILLACATASFEPQLNDTTLYRKEVVYPGHFIKKDETGGIEFELPVDERLIDHWVATFNRMKGNGVDVPVPIEHTSDPENRRGTVERLTKEFNPERNANCLYAYIRFRDRKTGDALSKTTQVSLFSPPDSIDGHGNTYIRPIKHVALTDYPLIPGLGKFEKAIAASLLGDKTIAASTVVLSERNTMRKNRLSRMASLARRLGVRCDDGASDEEIEDQIEAAWDADDGSELEIDPVAELNDDIVDEEDGFGEGVGLSDEDMLDGEEDIGMGEDDVLDEEEDVIPMSSRRRSAQLSRRRSARLSRRRSARLSRRRSARFSDEDTLDDEEDIGMGEDDALDEEGFGMGEDDLFDEEEGVDMCDDDPLDEEEGVGMGDDLMDDGELDEDPLDAMASSRRRSGRRISASITNEVVNARRVQIKDLARRRKITPVQASELAQRYCNERKVAIAMSTSGSSSSDGFDFVMSTLRQNRPQYSTRSRTGPQQLGGLGDGNRSPLVANAARRAAKAKK